MEHENVLKPQDPHNLIESIDIVLSSSLADRLKRKKEPPHVTSLPFLKYLGEFLGASLRIILKQPQLYITAYNYINQCQCKAIRHSGTTLIG